MPRRISGPRIKKETKLTVTLPNGIFTSPAPINPASDCPMINRQNKLTPVSANITRRRTFEHSSCASSNFMAVCGEIKKGSVAFLVWLMRMRKPQNFTN